ncbi:MAG: hypothetical protein ABJG41_15745 [Cyclobacteriaceae bacterium]
MLTILKKGTPIKEQIKKVQEVVAKKQSGIDTNKYLGALKTKLDPISYQQQMRDEWK